MKNLVLVVLLVVVAIAVYDFMNRNSGDAVVPATEMTEPVESDAMMDKAVEDIIDSEKDAVINDKATTDESISMILPVDMPEEAQDEMHASIMEYNKCMMQNRLEYHQQGNDAEQVASKTLAACESNLDALATTLLANDVNEGVRKGYGHDYA